MNLLLIIGAILLLTVFAVVFGEPSGRGASRDFNRTHGKWRVRYNDGQFSEPMCRDVADDYAKIFGGVVVPKNPKKYSP